MKRWLTGSEDLLIALGAVGVVALLVLIGLALLGHPPFTVLATWFQGAAGSWTRFALSLQKAGP
ncbi:MAG TPA: hypothetical protein VHX44_18125, partial [Planctomycetota bacterium]|nr:hypothetical protein [Planctomycetota bacterium]